MFVYDHQIHAGGTHVFLGTGIDQPKSIEGKAPTQDVAAHVGHQRQIQFHRQLLPLHAVHGFVGGEVQIGCLGIDVECFRDRAVMRFFRRAGNFNGSVEIRFFDRLGRPGARIGVSRFPVGRKQVHGDLHELRGRASMQE